VIARDATPDGLLHSLLYSAVSSPPHTSNLNQIAVKFGHSDWAEGRGVGDFELFV
jgi:hypothetical protein